MSISDNSTNYLTMFGIKGSQFGKEVISLQCSVDYILKFLEIDRSVQRDMIEKQVSSISKYIQYGLDGNNIYFPPLIFSARGKGIFNTVTNEFSIRTIDNMIILDGQHRIRAFEIIKKRLELSDDPEDKRKLDYIRNFPFTLQVFTNLTLDQEKQLFTDVNTKSSAVSNTLLIMYKDNDLCSKLVKSVIYNHSSISSDKFEVRSKTTKTKLMTAFTLYNLTLTLNEGIFVVKGNNSKLNVGNYDLYKESIEEFLTLLVKYAPDHSLDRSKYIIMNPNVLKGIARAVFLLRKNNEKFNMEEFFKHVVSLFDWSHKNKKLKQVGIPYNPKTKKYRINVGTRTTSLICDLLLQDFLKNKEVVINV
ncbi:DGQHR domain-containing protein (plasmid) [Bacillus cereus]|uniref:DNA sulfur modification protein DndB n=1 Tax=Bacillus cereus TaxID=1396 RepID=UPI001290BD40|nr:DNA sulfur modification protein DndB [Bacillus cereus]QFY03802.1 DGQHR domain-containing protein [Bacillus cereus]